MKAPPLIASPRWTPLEYHPEQFRLWHSRARFKVVSAGRRSGKTELAKRAAVLFAVLTTRPMARIVLAAPTRPQAKKIFWADIKALVPERLKADQSETELTITLQHNGSKIEVLGMDEPARIEGSPVDFLVLDEFANMKADVWGANCRPALATRGRPGFAWLTGVPEGRNHYYRLARKAQKAKNRAWDFFTWKSADILPDYEIAEARATMDPIFFRQEFEGSFETIAGRAYYQFDEKTHAVASLEWDRRLPLRLSFDFNVEPGTALIIQEKDVDRRGFFPSSTCVIDEVYIERNSYTEIVCKQIVERYGEHDGPVYVYGDPAGGARHTSSSATDWDTVDEVIGRHFRRRGNRVQRRTRKADPGFKARIVSTNSRLKVADGTCGTLIDPRCENLIEDLEGVQIKEGTTGEIDKSDKSLTHLTDELAYYCEYEHSPLAEETEVGEIE